MPAISPSSGSGRPQLVRRYVLRSLLVVAVTTSVLVLAVSWSERKQELGLAVDLASRVSQHLFKELDERWLPTHPQLDLDPNDEEFAALDRLFGLHRQSLRILRIVWFDAKGHVLYCCNQDLHGERPQGDGLLETALAGQTGVAKRPAGAPMHLEGGHFDVPLLEIYVPAGEGLDARLKGHVMELYMDATQLERRVTSTAEATLLICVTCAGLLFLAVLRLVRGAQADLLAQNAELRHLFENLEKTVEQRTQELVRTRRLADVGTLAAGLAHEINNPLAIIGSCAQGLLDRLRRGNGSLEQERGDFEEYLRSIEGETFRCKRITESLLDFARTRPPRAVLVTLCDLIRDIEILVRPLAASRGQSLRVSCECEGAQVRVAPEELKQVLVNLLQNAFDAGAEAGADPGTQDKVVEVRVEQRDNTAQVTVRDYGSGLAAVGTEKIFEPFFTTKVPGQGVGMGLSISRHIAELHGGRLTAEIPATGPGALFRLVLPLAPVVAAVPR